jgi:hypothetical protein
MVNKTPTNPKPPLREIRFTIISNNRFAKVPPIIPDIIKIIKPINPKINLI